MTGAEAKWLVESGTPCEWQDKSGRWHDCLITPSGWCAFQEEYDYRIKQNEYDLPVGMKATRDFILFLPELKDACTQRRPIETRADIRKRLLNL